MNKLREQVIKIGGTHTSEGIDGCGHCSSREVNNLSNSEAYELLTLILDKVVEAVEKRYDQNDEEHDGQWHSHELDRFSVVKSINNLRGD